MANSSQERAILSLVSKVKSGSLTSEQAIQSIASKFSLTPAIASSLFKTWYDSNPAKHTIKSVRQLLLAEKESEDKDSESKESESKESDDSDSDEFESDDDAGDEIDLSLIEDSPDGEEDLEIEESDLDPDLETEVNELDSFEGESTAAVTQTELLDAIKAIETLTNVILEETGENPEDGFEADELGDMGSEMLDMNDQAEELPGTSPAEVPDLPPELNQSWVHVLAVGGKPTKRLARPQLSSQTLSDIGDVEIVSDTSRIPTKGLADYGPSDNSYVATIVASSVPKITRSDKIQSKFLQLQSGWKDSDQPHLESWCYALKLFSSAHNGIKPRDAKDWAAVQYVAQSYYDKHFVNPSQRRDSYVPVSSSVLRKVVTVMQNRAQKLVSSKTQPKAAPKKTVSSAAEKNARVERLLEQIRSEITTRKKSATGPTGTISAPESGDELGEGGKPRDLRGKVEFGGGEEMKPAEVHGDPQSTITQYPLTGNDGSLVADTDPTERAAGAAYNFKSDGHSAIELPAHTGKGAISEVIVFQSIGNGVHILQDVYHAAGGSGRCTWVSGNDAVKILLNGTTRGKTIYSNFSSPIVIPMRTGGTAVMIKQSSVLGLIAVEAPFVQGIKNSKYELFSLKKGLLVSASGNAIRNPRTEFLIASATSNKGIVKSAIKRDFFTEVERMFVLSQRLDYVQQARYARAIKQAALNELKQREEIISGLRQQLITQQKHEQETVTKVTSSLSALKKTADVDDLGYISQEAQRFIASSKQEFAAVQNRNVDRLAQLM